MTTPRYPLAPLAAALGIELLGATWSDRPDPTVLQGHPALAAALGVSRRTVQRWSVHGVPVDRLDALAVATGRHPSALWSDWNDDEHEPDDGFPPLDDVDLEPWRSVAA